MDEKFEYGRRALIRGPFSEDGEYRKRVMRDTFNNLHDCLVMFIERQPGCVKEIDLTVTIKCGNKMEVLGARGWEYE